MIDISGFKKLQTLKDFLGAKDKNGYTYVLKLFSKGDFSRLPEGCQAVKVDNRWIVLQP
jgi:hypothetical protein